MLLAVQVSSMKTRRPGSRSTCLSNQSCRCFRTSGRSCSIAWPVFFCASCPGARKTDEVPLPRRSVRLRPAPPVVLPAKRPSAPPIQRGLPPLAPRSGANAPHRLAVWRQRRPCRAEAHANGSPSRGQRQIAPPPPGSSIRYRSLPKAASANPSKAGDRSMPASFTSTDYDSQNAIVGNPCRFIPVEIRSNRPVHLRPPVRHSRSHRCMPANGEHKKPRPYQRWRWTGGTAPQL